MPTGMSITPKKTLALMSQMLFCRLMLSLQIQRVAKMSPATMCDHMAVTPALDDNPAPIPTINPSGCDPLFTKSMRPLGFKSITANQMTIGPKKNHCLFIICAVLPAQGCNNMANQNGPTQKVVRTKRRVQRSMLFVVWAYWCNQSPTVIIRAQTKCCTLLGIGNIDLLSFAERRYPVLLDVAFRNPNKYRQST